MNNNNSNNKVKYQKVSQSEVEILIDNNNKNSSDNKRFLDTNEKAFDFTSINDYNSIFKYSSLRKNNHFIESEATPVKGVEKYINILIVGFFYLIFVAFLPFSLLVCLKKVKENERIVVYRLGRIKKPAIKPGYCILFPLIDNFKRFNVVQKEICITNIQIYNHENAIIDLSTTIRYKILDVIKLTNTLADLNISLKSIARSVLVNLVSKKNTSKIEIEKSYLKEEVILQMNEEIRKWGVQVIEIDIIINDITKDENAENGEDPALRSISLVFKSLFNNQSTDASSSVANGSKPGTSGLSPPSVANLFGAEISPDLLTLFQGITPIVVSPEEAAKAMQGGIFSNNDVNIQPETTATDCSSNSTSSDTDSIYSPIKLLRLLEPFINEKVVKEINTVYEFHIRTNTSCDIYHLDLKNVSRGKIGQGPSLFSKADCIIKMTDNDLKELLMDNLKPFTAYMSGRIEIDGVLQDVFRLKKLINSATARLIAKKPI